MRTLLIAALSLSALTPSRDADACGNYREEPRVLRLSTHFIPPAHANATEHHRSFVLFGNATPEPKLAWRLLAPRSYDGTQIANDMLLANPVTLTLVGPSGTRIVSSKKHVFLSRSWDFDKPTNAIDIGNGEGFSIAIEGKHANAAWIALEDTTYEKATMRAWVTALGVSPSHASSVHVSRIKGTDFETVSTFPKDGKKMVTFLKHGDRNLGRYEGSPMGAFTNDGATKLVLADGALVTTVDLGSSLGV